MESIGGDLNQMPRVPLADAHVAEIRAIGTPRSYEKGCMVAEVGDPMDRFVYVVDGEIEAVDPFSGARMFDATMGPTQFMGDLALLNAGSFTLPMRAATDLETIEVEREPMMALMARLPELSDHVLTVFAARRRRTFEEHRSAIRVIGGDKDPAVQAVASFLSRNRIPYDSFDLETDDEEGAALCRLADHTPSVVFGKDHIVEEPTPRKVAQLLGLDLNMCNTEAADLVIVGGGPAGVAAAVYAGSEGLCAVVIEDTAIGGQAGMSSRIENYMGFPTGISGTDLIFRGEIQALKFGARFVMPRRVEGLERRDGQFCVKLNEGDEVCARAVLVATGVQYRRLPLPGLERLEGAGIFYAATDLEARFCRGREAVIIGGGNSAGQAAMHLSRSAGCVHLIVREEKLSQFMSSYLLERLQADPAIKIHLESEVTALHGEERLEGVTVKGPDGETRIDAGAMFVMIGAAPNTDWLKGMVELDEQGFVRTGRDSGGRSQFETGTHGIFAVGDVRATSVKRVASAVGEGSVVVSEIWKHIDDLGEKNA